MLFDSAAIRSAVYHPPCAFTLGLISGHYAPGNITIFHLERCILAGKKKKTKMKFQKMDDPSQNYLKVTHPGVIKGGRFPIRGG